MATALTAHAARRDVRAGAFTHPLGANRAYDHMAHVALGEAAPLR